MSKGRPKKIKPIEELKFTSFQDDITLFRNYLIDSLEDEECSNKQYIEKFLNLEQWRQNIFIVYMLNKDKKFTFKALAEMLQVNKNELMRVIRDIKKELAEYDISND